MKTQTDNLDQLIEFVIPVAGLLEGVHNYQFEIDERFFKCFEASLIKHGNLTVDFVFEKRSSMYVLEFDIEGEVQTTCDRCLEPMSLFIEGENQLLVKFSENPSEDPDVVHIPLETSNLNVAQYVYEFISLTLPMNKMHDDMDEDCPVDMNQYAEDTTEEEDTSDNSLWDNLKDLNLK